MSDGDHVLRLVEHRSASLDDAWVAAVDPDFWKSTELRISKSPDQEQWQVLADSLVGVARTKTARGYLTVHVTPKLDRCDPFFLADYAYGQRHQPLRQLPGEQALVDQVRSDPAACLLLWHVLAIHRFSARWLRRDQITVDTELHGKVRGSLRLGTYVSRHLAHGDAATIPVRLRERTPDTPNNRLLKAGLRRAAQLALQLPVPAARTAVRAAVNAALPRFAQVTDVPGTPRDLRATSTKGPLRHYTNILEVTTGLLRGDYFSGDPGTSETPAFLWSMPTLFQEALRGVLSEHPELTLTTGVPVATIHDSLGVRRSSSKVDPDFVATTSTGGVLIMDAKYKQAARATDTVDDDVVIPGARRITVPRSDIYQMVAYRQHDRWPNPTGALIYPITLADNEALPAPYQIRGFGPPLHICFLDVGPNARANLTAFHTVVGELALTASRAPTPRELPARPRLAVWGAAHRAV